MNYGVVGLFTSYAGITRIRFLKLFGFNGYNLSLFQQFKMQGTP